MINYRSIIKNRELRLWILKRLTFIPDKYMLKLQYFLQVGRLPNFKNPQRYTEKIQLYKMQYRNEILHTCVDKYAVREYVKSKGLENILVELYDSGNSIKEIDIEKLPNSFVIKTINGGGGNNVVICRDKKKLKIEDVKGQVKTEEFKPFSAGREWAYYNVPAGIVVEQFLENEENPKESINDYKIFCFNGKAKYICVDVDRFSVHKRSFYDIKWNKLDVVASDGIPCDRVINKPKNLNNMIDIAERLSLDFPHVRVDLYNISGKIYFGELTFYPWSGYVQFMPDDFDFELGKMFDLNFEKGKGVK